MTDHYAKHDWTPPIQPEEPRKIFLQLGKTNDEFVQQYQQWIQRTHDQCVDIAARAITPIWHELANIQQKLMDKSR